MRPPPSARSTEINCGIYCADPAVLMASLKKLRPNNAQGEYYLTDAVHALIARGVTVVALESRRLTERSSA